MMLLHAGALLAPDDLWSAWSFEPAVVAVFAITIGFYLVGLRRIARLSTRHARGIQKESFFFLAGMIATAVAMLSPLHRMGGILFSAHMIQHELLMTIAAPLLVLGRPVVPLLWSLPLNARRRIGITVTHGAASSVWRAISNPLSAWLLHAIAIWGWHAPGLYDASVTSELVHTAQHFCFMFTALLFWWSILAPAARSRGGGMGIISLFTTGLHTTLLGALIATAQEPMYSAYTAAGTSLWGFTPLTDQQLGGIIMWIPAGVVYMGVALYLFPRWIRESGARVRAAEKIRRQKLDGRIVQAAVAIVAVAILAGCHGMNDQQAGELTGGNVDRGKEAMRRYGCKSCHAIPGIAGANGLVGPPLGGIASRSFIAGVLVNSPDNMITWLRNPPAVDNKTAMPNMGVTEKDARDIAAYLYTLR